MNRGVFTAPDLAGIGLSRWNIEQRVRDGDLTHVSRNWYAEPDADPRLLIAARAHTRLGCLTACSYHGLWVLPEPNHIHALAAQYENREHVAAQVLKATRGMHSPIVHRVHGTKMELVCPVDEAIEQVARFHDTESALIVLESALNKNVVDVEWADAMLDRIPKRRGRRLTGFQLLSESGSETRVSFYLRTKGLRVRQQVPLFPNEANRVDILVGESWVIECDSVRYHSSIAAYRNDRERDLYLQSKGYQVTRLTYEQIWEDWENTKTMLDSLISHRDYLKKPRGSKA
ncbi:hypothetical protein [Trueperella bialowiezensis]|nr:hypothetical protein [Trueperella bialowiezensis]